MSLRTLLTALLLTTSVSAMADTAVVDLSNRTSADLLPVAQNFIGKDGTVSAYGNQLIVNAQPDKIEGLRALLAQLDTPAKRLLITVDTHENNQQTNGQVISYSTESREGGIQQIQASEGVPALIQVGQSVPLTSTQQDSYGRLQNQTQYRNVTQGFYVTASVTGETVHLAISTNRDRMSQERPDVVNVQSTDTTVSGRLGEWISLAGINRATQADKSSTTRSYSTQGRDDLTVRVKVDSLN
ncbi:MULTISPECIES: secretin N-terminal domain-containing protein [Pseudomonas]|uniref:secretin N-terminal domain-containing protein n=1 Tax=Pseudomonas TaxID=286 RepID=UPI001AE24612|nr:MULTISPECIES: secretin N-terminal domain-containing protein [unclassified Pseudomonas]MBP1125047.1 type II secretory pathway component GspD/PulD (secretin) [Pseudomonas sp. PvP025]MDQ0398907.1 type II secretory pathway component GspD/PulD (secretin) [Pseudomonas sp. PvP006]